MKATRRDLLTGAGVAGAAAAAAAAGATLPAGATAAKTAEDFRNPFSTETEIVPGMRAQGEAVKRVYVESEYAPLKACLFGNAFQVEMPDPENPEAMARLFAESPKEMVDYLRSKKYTNLRESDPAKWDRLIAESEAVAEAYRQEGVTLIRNEGPTPKEVLEYASGWSGTKQLSIYGQSAYEVIGNVLIHLWEVAPMIAVEMGHREATVAMLENDPDAVWLAMPLPYPAHTLDPGPFLSPGDIRIFEKTVIVGIGVPDRSHINDYSKPRSSGDELGAELLRRLLKPFGWDVEVVYFDSRISYHIDCVMAALREGLIAMPKDALWTPLPVQFKDWEIMDVPIEDIKIGGCNLVPLSGGKIVMTQGTTRLAKDMAKRGLTPVEVPYKESYTTFESGIHCSTAAIWRES